MNQAARALLTGSVALLSILLINSETRGQVKSEYDRFDDETTVSMSIVLKGTKEDPELELVSYEYFRGKTINKRPEHIDFMFCKRKGGSWDSRILDLKLFVDGERLDTLNGRTQNGKNAHFTIPWNLARKIANAGKVEGRVEIEEFEINGPQLAPLREFLRVITPSTETQAPTTPANRTGTNTKPDATIGSTVPAKKENVRNKVGIEMVWIAPGNFMMGSDYSDSERPVHQVTIREGFYMGQTEVTQGQWQSVMGTNVRQQRDKVDRSWPIVGEGSNYPIYYVSWDEAQEFIGKLNQMNDGYIYRLPTEAEWEYAARAGSKDPYPYMSIPLDLFAWYGNNSGKKQIDLAELKRSDKDYMYRLIENGNQTHEVGTRLKNLFFLYDMLGNVGEWCEDPYHANYEGAPTDGTAWLRGGDQNSREARGGAWDTDAQTTGFPSNRFHSTRDDRIYHIGFRVVAVARNQ